MDRYIIRQICTTQWYDKKYLEQLSIALFYNPSVAWYCKEKAPEIANNVERLIATAPKDCTKEQIRMAELYILEWHDWAVVLVYPDVMNQNCPYIYNWDKARLLELVDFTDKIVLDVGAGTGRLAFAAAERARHIYASEPVDRLA